MNVDDINACASQSDNPIELEASGGIDLSNVHEYAKTGVGFISIGRLTHSVQNFDLSLTLVDCG